METFYDFEIRVIRELVTINANADSMRTLLREAAIESVQWLPQGYRVTARHSAIGKDHTKVADFPYVFGAYENIRTRFDVSIQDGCLVLDCESTNGCAVPAYFRERHVQIDVLNHWVDARST